MDYPISQPGLDLYLNKFTDGVPGVRPASVIPSITVNAVVDELKAVIVSGGLVPAEATLTQVRDAILAMITNNGEAFSAVRPLAVTTVLTTADLGKLVKITATGGTFTFPAIASTPAGKVLSFVTEFATGTAVLKGNAAELLANTFGATANTFTLNAGEAIQYVSNGVSWDPFGYEATVGVTPAASDNSTKLATTSWFYSAIAAVAIAAGFAASLALNGYIKLPSWLGGLIIQWGAVASGALTASTPSSVTATFPISFPSACYVVSGNLNSGVGNGWVSFTSESLTPTGFTSRVSCQAATASLNLNYIAIGR